MKAEKKFIVTTGYDGYQYKPKVQLWGKEDSEGIVIESNDSGDNAAEVAKVIKVPEALINVLNNICADTNESDKVLNKDIKDLAEKVFGLEERIEEIKRRLR